MENVPNATDSNSDEEKTVGTLQKTVVLTGVHRGPHQAFYTSVKLLVLAQHPVVLF